MGVTRFGTKDISNQMAGTKINQRNNDVKSKENIFLKTTQSLQNGPGSRPELEGIQEENP